MSYAYSNRAEESKATQGGCKYQAEDLGQPLADREPALALPATAWIPPRLTDHPQ